MLGGDLRHLERFPMAVRTTGPGFQTRGMTSTSPRRGGHVVVGVDGSPASEHAVQWAAEEAHLRHRGLSLVHTQKRVSASELAWLGSAGLPPREVNDDLYWGAERILERARALATALHPELPTETVLGYGDARSHLLELATVAPMVVVGTRGHGPVAGLLLGSVSGALVRHAECPVAVVRPPAPSACGILIAADASEESLDLVENAYREASLHQARLTVVHCLWDGQATQTPWTSVAE